MTGVVTGVFLVVLAAETAALAAGAALPDRIWRLGEPSTFEGAGPTDCERSATSEIRTTIDWNKLALALTVLTLLYCLLLRAALLWAPMA